MTEALMQGVNCEGVLCVQVQGYVGTLYLALYFAINLNFSKLWFQSLYSRVRLFQPYGDFHYSFKKYYHLPIICCILGTGHKY